MAAGLRSKLSAALSLIMPPSNAALAVILLSFVLAVGFLLIILSCALWQNWLPLLVGPSVLVFPPIQITLNSIVHRLITSALTFVLAPLPNAVFSHCGGDEFGSSYESSPAVDFGRFLTAIFVVTGFALPIVLAHSDVINSKACVMSIAGGGCVLVSFILFGLCCGATHRNDDNDD